MTQAEKLGIKIVELFKLPKLPSKYNREEKVRFSTSWGDKTLEGIGQCVFRLVEENENNEEE